MLDISTKTIYQDKSNGVVVEAPNDRRGVYTLVFLTEQSGPMRVPVTFRQASSIRDALSTHMDEDTPSILEVHP